MPKKTKKGKAISSGREVLNTSDSYKSLLYGIVTVIILFIIGFGTVKLLINRPTPAIDDHAVSISNVTPIPTEEQAGELYLPDAPKATGTKTHVVLENESLWQIAEKVYNDGDKWVEIAQANNISDPSIIFKGDKLKLPQLTTVKTELSSDVKPDVEVELKTENKDAQTSQNADIKTETYTIKTGDDLWDIAVRVYNDGYRWVDIAQANNISDPNLIHADNVLKLPR
ncbi:MAG TPA: LysM peptidoglycan-binding domain-containing protein [Candidatus Levybacteria bacterium]|nr:LysM peptidoglycan-binding domain-containing protein [Candidatus Levybacteria bacterium]